MFGAVFTCYLTYYKPYAKKVDLVRARPLAGAPKELICQKILFYTLHFSGSRYSKSDFYESQILGPGPALFTSPSMLIAFESLFDIFSYLYKGLL